MMPKVVKIRRDLVELINRYTSIAYLRHKYSQLPKFTEVVHELLEEVAKAKLKELEEEK